MELKMSDLMSNCEKCEGLGNLEHPDLAKRNSGFGTKLTWASPVDCEACDGKGIILTDSGKTVVEFIGLIKAKRFIYW